MKPSEIRKTLHTYIDSADSDSLKYFNEAILAYKNGTQNNNVIQRPPISPMSAEEFYAMIDEAEDNISKGMVYSQAEVEKMAKKRHARV